MSRKPPEIKIFEKWGTQDIEVGDPGLGKYLSVKPMLFPHSGGRHEHKRFRKSALSIVERLVNNMMRSGRTGG
jgi:small subunit ribosomal protein S7